MNELLPKIEELIAYTNENGTFYECGFNKNFNELTFQKKLEIVNDIVRQTILVNPFPDPQNHTKELSGDCYTAALASIEYLNLLQLGKNPRCVLCRKRTYDPSDITSKHIAILVDDEEGKKYLFDATPYVASKYGTVTELKKDNNFYEEYKTLSSDELGLIYFLKELLYKDKCGILDQNEIPYYLQIISEAMSYPILNGLSAQAYTTLGKRMQIKFEQDCLFAKASKLNPYSKYNDNYVANTLKRTKLVEEQIKVWQLELNDLLLSKKDYKRQLELAQNIYQEMKRLDNRLEKYANINGKNLIMTNMTPRYFFDNDLNTIMIKPSAYFLGVRATIRERFLLRGQRALYEYFTNLSQPTDITKIKPMCFSHTLGDRYERSMDGTSDIILLKGKSDELYEKKRILRNELGKNLKFKEVTWYDNQKIKWEPWVTNLVHSTDNPSEASMHFMIGYPEQQVMTRFMYPNPKLEEKEKIK